MKEDLIQINKFSYLHDNKKIFFSKTDHLLQTLELIKTIELDVILITGNSDYGIFFENDFFVIKDLNNNFLTNIKYSSFPKNIKHWFAQNNLTEFDFIKNLPLGIGNDTECFLDGHGFTSQIFTEKIKPLIIGSAKKDFDKITKSIYVNFDVNTNLNHRMQILNYCNRIGLEINTENLNFSEYCKKIKEYKAVLCPCGNGLDTFRFYETILLNRVPILLKYDNYKIYENFYSKFPCIIMNSIEELSEKEILEQKINDVLSHFEKKAVSFSYWEREILKFKKMLL